LKLGEDREQRLKFEVNQRKHVENLSWRNIGKDFLNLAQAYVNAVRTEETVNNISSATLSMSETID
jgi:hypothetical protein